MDIAPCIKKNDKMKKQSKKGGGGDGRDKVSEKEREKEKRGVEREKLISKIYGIWNVGFRQSKRQSRSMHRELRVGFKILEFCQTPRGRKFSYMDHF